MHVPKALVSTKMRCIRPHTRSPYKRDFRGIKLIDYISIPSYIHSRTYESFPPALSWKPHVSSLDLYFIWDIVKQLLKDRYVRDDQGQNEECKYSEAFKCMIIGLIICANVYSRLIHH